MLGKLFGRGGESAQAGPHVLPAPRKRKNGMYELRALGDRRVLDVVEAADSRDWEAVKAALVPFDLGRDHGVLGELVELDGVEEWIGRAVEEDKEHRAAALLISGARHITWGWEARTSARAKNVTQEQWKVFHERLDIAEAQLFEVAELRPEWVTPWRQLLTSGRGVSLGRTINETRWDAALRRDPLDLDCHEEWLSQLQPRWGGEPGEAGAFARQAYDRAPEGHRLGCVIAMARIEDWVESDDGACLVAPEVRDELVEAAEHSILHPSYERSPGWQGDFNKFAMALSLSGEHHTLRRVFKELDGAYTPWPWRYLADPQAEFARRSRRA
ncbi:hypothetical protein [Streptomyces sp. NBC_01465]|uniref:hypothetical protein n=1 Tax=Streptomyces sp. NBC_01465 TaxID=2903878 RepID=UPI002E35F956|nr:hypothetical protein [Streptomyces sp. NBC_01465]